MDKSEGVSDHKENQQSNDKVVSFFSTLIREFLAVFCWGYAIAKLFIFDVDIFLAEKFFPNYLWLLTINFFSL